MHGTPRTALTVLVAAIALIVAAGAGATASMLITGKQIKDGTVTGRDLRNGSVAVKDLKPAARTKLKGATGATGPRGATGPAGPAGAAGLSGFEVLTRTVAIPGLGGTGSVAAACPAGKKALSATASYAAPLSGLLSQVTRTGDSAFSASGLNLLGVLTNQVLTLDVVCATIPA